MASVSAPGSRCTEKAAPVVTAILRSERPTLRGTLRNNKENLVLGALVVFASTCLYQHGGVSIGELAEEKWSFTTTTIAIVCSGIFFAGYFCRWAEIGARGAEASSVECDPAADE